MMIIRLFFLLITKKTNINGAPEAEINPKGMGLFMENFSSINNSVVNIVNEVFESAVFISSTSDECRILKDISFEDFGNHLLDMSKTYSIQKPCFYYIYKNANDALELCRSLKEFDNEGIFDNMNKAYCCFLIQHKSISMIINENGNKRMLLFS